MSQEILKTELKRQILKLCSYCCELFSGDLERYVYLEAASGFLQRYDETKLMERVIEKMSPHWNNILGKNENFFLLESDKIFNELPIDVKLFSSLFGKDKNGKDFLSVKEKDKIWKYFHKFTRLSCEYIHYMRLPEAQYDENKKLIGGTYKRSYKDHLKIKPVIQTLGIKLKFT